MGDRPWPIVPGNSGGEAHRPTFPGTVFGMIERIQRLISVGVTPDMEAARARGVQTNNVVALLAAVFDITYALFLAAVATSSFVLLYVTNGISVVMYGAILLANARHRWNLAVALMLVAGPFNLIPISFVMGIGTGGFLYLMLLPLVATLIAPPGRLEIPILGWSAGATSIITVLLVGPSVPDAIAGTAVETGLLISNGAGSAVLTAVVSVHFKRVADTAEAGLVRANRRSERLLLNILPEEIAERLKAGEEPIADRSEGVTVLFADLVGSTPMSERLSADQMVGVLNEIFTPFDDLADELGLEKIKTVGDAYMVVGGLPVARPDHVEAVVEMALAMRRELADHHVEGFGPLQMRFGIHTGPVVAGVIGKRKFSYDLWGDTVNTAARMESHGVPGEIQVTGEVMAALRGRYTCESRGVVDIKGKGRMETFFLRD